MLKIFERYRLPIALIAQTILLLVGFNKFYVNPNDYMFQNLWDGFKNYLTFQGYFDQIDQPNLLKYTQMNYPFGEYIFYTDNTPLLSFPLKLISTYIFDLSDNALTIYHLATIAGVLLSTFFLYRILNIAISHSLFLVVLSVGLVWINPQSLRLEYGHYNLFWSWVLLGTLYYLLRQYLHWEKEGQISRKWAIAMVLILYAGAFVHLYFLLINLLMIGFFGLMWAGSAYRSGKNWQKPLVQTIGFGSIAFAAAWLTIRLSDGEYTQRLEAKGYDWEYWKLNFSAFFTGYPHNGIRFPIEAYEPTFGYESLAYLGGFALFSLLGLGVLYLAKCAWWQPFRAIFGGEKRWVFFLLIAALLMTFIALGDKIILQPQGFIIYNYLNIFYYLNKMTDFIGHFRCLGRFSWFMFWAFNIAIAVIVEHYWRQRPELWFKAILVGLVVLLVFDTKDAVRHRNNTHFSNQLTNKDNFSDLTNLVKQIQPKDYQAILPIPYFHVGTEDFQYTIDPPEYWVNENGQISYLTGLPMMGCQMSRTARYQAVELFSIFSPEGISKNLLDRLSDKPILVFYHKKWNQTGNEWCQNKEEPARSVAYGGSAFIEKYAFPLIVENQTYALYRWDIKK